MEFKTFVLLENMDTNAPIFQQLPDGKRVRLSKMPRHRPHLQVTFIDKEGKSRTIRYKVSTDKIFQDEQIKDGILANERFTQNEYNDPIFKNGVLVTNKPTLVKFLKSHPECFGFEGICDEIREPRFRELDKGKDVKTTNDDLRKRAKAINKILELDLEGAQNMLLRLNGTFFITPSDLEECQNLLVDFLDNAEEAGLDAILKESLNVDEKTTVLIGKLLNSGTLSFDALAGKISKKDKNGKWYEVRDMADSYSLEERKRLFSDFLNTEDGKPLKNDLEGDLKAVEENLKNKNDSKK